MVLFFFITGSRLSIKYMLNYINENSLGKNKVSRTIIYGAGSAGRQLASSLENDNNFELIAFIDDDKSLHNQILIGKKVYPPSHLEKIINKKSVKTVLLAIPSISRFNKMKIIDRIKTLDINVRTLPSISDLAQGKIKVSDIKELDVEDILGRDQIEPDQKLISKTVFEKVVIITGAGGSIGSELARQIFSLKPKKLILIENNEYALYKINLEITDILTKTKKIKNVKLIPLLGSVTDHSRMETIIRFFKPDSIYHTAAYKHVPLVEENICEGVKNNVFGTLNMVNLSYKYKVSNFVLISTDKAVRPTNIMGATKRLAELCLQSIQTINNIHKTQFCIVRFGNVLDSSGSVIPKFKQQILNGGPLTVTDPKVTRYFMTLKEATQLVLQAASMTNGFDVFVLDMSNPVKILDLAKKMITLSGLTEKNENSIEGDIEIKFIGLRPGEKLFEELLIGNDPKKTSHPKIMKISDPFISNDILQAHFKDLKNYVENNEIDNIKNLLKKLVESYETNSEVVDQIYFHEKKYNE
jgi:FlaA1/EpsC-like NDP-sugar epimerase